MTNQEWIRKVITPKGNGSTFVTIPRKLCMDMGLKGGDHVRISNVGSRIYIEKVE